MCISCLDHTFVHVLYFPLVSPTYQSELIQLYHNNMKRSYNGCFYFAKRTRWSSGPFRSDDVFSA
ncbi:hypothetical protein bcgnr5383_52430 [Bacillus cereus]